MKKIFYKVIYFPETFFADSYIQGGDTFDKVKDDAFISVDVNIFIAYLFNTFYEARLYLVALHDFLAVIFEINAWYGVIPVDTCGTFAETCALCIGTIMICGHISDNVLGSNRNSADANEYSVVFNGVFAWFRKYAAGFCEETIGASHKMVEPCRIVVDPNEDSAGVNEYSAVSCDNVVGMSAKNTGINGDCGGAILLSIVTIGCHSGK